MCLFVEGSSPRLAYVVALVPVEPPDGSGVARREDVAQAGLVGSVLQNAGRVEVLREVKNWPAEPSREVV